MGGCVGGNRYQQTEKKPIINQWLDESVFPGNIPAQINSSLIKKLPHRLIGLITFENTNKQFAMGTGILLSPNLVLTVAHNLFDHKSQQNFMNHRFYKGISGEAEEYYTASKFFLPEAFKNNNDPEYDYGLLKLDKSTDAYNFIQLNGNFSQLSQGATVGIFGYTKQHSNWKRNDPANQYKFTAIQSGLRLDQKANLQISVQSRDRLTHKISTYSGFSGSPIILFEEEEKMSIIGIHKGGKSDQSYNVGKRVTPEFIKQLEKEAEKLKAEPFNFQKTPPPKQTSPPLAIDIKQGNKLIGEKRLDTSLRQSQRNIKNIQALQEYEKALKIDDKSWDTWNNFGVAYSELGNYNQAINAYSQAIKISPDQWEPYNNKANAQFHQQLYESALSNYEKAIKLHPTHQAYYNKGITLSSLQRYQQARDSFQKVVQMEPNHSQAHLKLALTQYSLKQYNRAVQSLEEVVKLEPDNHEAYSTMGTFLLIQKKYQLAIQKFKKAINKGPQNANINYQMGVAYSEISQLPGQDSSSQLQKAVKCFKSAIAQDQTHVEAYKNLAVALSKQLKFQEVIGVYDKLLKIQEKATHFFNKGITHFSLNQLEEAIQSFNKAIALEPTYASAYFNKGVALSKLERHQEAANSYEKTVLYDSKNVQAHFNLGVSLQKLNHPNQALDQFEKVVKLDPNHADALFQLGCLESSLEMFQPALKSFKASSIIKKRSQTYYNIGVTLQKLGRFEEAKQYLEPQ